MDVEEESHHENCKQLTIFYIGHYRENKVNGHLHPHSPPVGLVPLPDQWSTESNTGRKRNERERDRVRYVNESYARLKEHLPLVNVNRRISKVQTLRCAIKYIRQLQKILTDI